MDDATLRDLVLNKIRAIAPEAGLDGLDPRKSFHDQIEIDSVDFLNLMMSLEEALDVHIPEADFPKLSSLDGCVGYLLPLLALRDAAGDRHLIN
jgi:acyl carrier protein